MSNKFFKETDKDNFFNKLKNKANTLAVDQDKNNVLDQNIQDAADKRLDASWIAWPKQF